MHTKEQLEQSFPVKMLFLYALKISPALDGRPPKIFTQPKIAFSYWFCLARKNPTIRVKTEWRGKIHT